MNHVTNFVSCSWPHKTALSSKILNYHLFLIKTSKDGSTGQSESSELLFSDLAMAYCKCFLLINLDNISHLSIKQTSAMAKGELGAMLQVGRLRPAEPQNHLGVWERTATGPAVLAPSLGLYNARILKSLETEANSLEDHFVLFCFFKSSASLIMALRIVQDHPVFSLP